MPEPVPSASRCAVCGTPLGPRFGWCGVCAKALCLACGQQHFCRSDCRASGCRAGHCVRPVEDGTLAEAWGLPPD